MSEPPFGRRKATFEVAFHGPLKIGAEAGLRTFGIGTLARIALGTVGVEGWQNLEPAAMVEILRRVKEEGWAVVGGEKGIPFLESLWSPLVLDGHRPAWLVGSEKISSRRIRSFFDALTPEGRTIVASLLEDGRKVFSELEEAAAQWTQALGTERG